MVAALLGLKFNLDDAQHFSEEAFAPRSALGRDFVAGHERLDVAACQQAACFEQSLHCSAECTSQPQR